MSATTVQSFYIAYYGRPADPSGLEYWVGRVEAEGGSFDSLVAAFGTSAEATELFSGLTDAQKINAVYQSTFGRDADAEGLAFYSAGLADGTFSVYDISKRILDGATTGDDAAIVANKITVAQAFTDELAADPELEAEYVGISATTAAKAVVSSVTADAASVTAATASIASTFSITETALTTSADTVAGTEGRDRISGAISNLNGTLQATDVIDGGAGSTDRLTLTMDTSFAGFSTGSVKNVETLTLSNTGSTSREFNATGVTGVKTINLDGSVGALTLTALPTGVEKISLSGQTATFSSAYIAGAAEQSASTTAVTLDLDSVGTSSSRVTATLEDVNALTVDSTGVNYVSIGGTDASSLILTGSGTLNATVASGSAVRAVDGSAATGALTLNLTGVSPAASASGITSVKTGSGADSITLGAEDIRANATVVGGDGADTLNLTSTSTSAVSAAYTLTGVETLAIGSVAASGALTLAANAWTGVESVSIDGDTLDSVSIAGFGAKDVTVNVLGASDSNADVDVDASGGATLNFTATGTSKTTTADAPAGDVTFSQASSLVATVGAYVDTDVTVTATKATSVTLNVESGKTAAGTEITEFGGTLSAPAATSFSLVGTGKITAATVTAAKATTGTITNGTTAGTVTITDGSKLTTLNLTSGNTLTVTSSAEMVKVQNLSIAANKGLVKFASNTEFDDASVVTVSGSGAASAVELGNLGLVDNGYNLTVNATGTLEGDSSTEGIELGNLRVSAGKAVSVSANSVTGAILIGTIGAVTTDVGAAAGDVEILAALAGSDADAKTNSGLEVGNINATGNVVIDASAANKVNLGTIAGNTVDIDMSNVETAAYTLGAISAKSSVNIDLSPLAAANSIAITGQTASTGMAVTVNGGIAAETLTVTADGASVASISLSGDLGAGTDVVVINGQGTKAKSITNSLENYDSASIHGGTGNDTITGGAQVDVIDGGAGTNILTGGAGADVFQFQKGYSTYTSVNRIMDLGSTDQIVYGGANLAKSAELTTSTASGSNAGGISGASASYTVNAYGVVAFTGTASGYDTLAEKAGILSVVTDGAAGEFAYFQHDGASYMFISGGTTGSDVSDDTVIELVGVALPTSAVTVGSASAAVGTTGVYGLGA